MTSTVPSTIFGRRREPHTVIIARGNQIRHFTVRPWMAAFAGSAVAAISIGYLLATSYLVLRDDLIGAAVSRQARMQHAYEDRISALRSQVDRITSRQLLDQKLMETRVSELLARQSQLSQRHGRLEPLVGRAERDDVGATVAPAAPNPDERASLGRAEPKVMANASDTGAFSLWSTRSQPAPGESQADRADKMFVSINQSLRSIETDQMKKVTTLADDAYQTAEAIGDALEQAGLPVDTSSAKESGLGGPLIAVGDAGGFDAKVRELDQALDKLEHVKAEARKLPIANPAPDRPVSSSFGVRTDPILGTPALHSGLDFRAPTGYPIKATAPGIVTKAEWNGGYGRMVEIDHGNGFTTRFAHMSEIDVAEGDHIEAGTVVGKVGSTGRSTGPHLHYEVRRNGTAVDPVRFLKVGRKISQLM